MRECVYVFVSDVDKEEEENTKYGVLVSSTGV